MDTIQDLQHRAQRRHTRRVATPFIVAALLAALTLTSVAMARAANAAPPPTETSRVVATIGAPQSKVIVRTKYRDFGYLGVKPIKVCAHTDPAGTTVRLEWRRAWTTVNMGEYKAGKARCKQLPLWAQQRTTNRGWEASGVRSFMRIGPVDLYPASFYVTGRMS